MISVARRVVSGDFAGSNDAPNYNPQGATVAAASISSDKQRCASFDNNNDRLDIPPSVVEYVDHGKVEGNGVAPVDAIISNHHSKSSTTGSSLSSDIEADDSTLDDEDDYHRSDPVRATTRVSNGNPQTGSSRLPRHVDQRMSCMERVSDTTSEGSARVSKNSSGNWGWYDDFHTTIGGDGSCSYDQQSAHMRKKKQGGGLLQQLGSVFLSTSLHNIIKHTDEENAALAIAAPNYVLGESISSQKLWKISAGNRPKQPDEERAFYERMWAQNFARSKVEYNVPVEVLTASSPQEHSPFDDENGFNDTQHTNKLSNYNLAIGETEGVPADPDIAAATLMSRWQHKPEQKKVEECAQQVINRRVRHGSDVDLTVLVHGENTFGTTVSKSFRYREENGTIGNETVNISIVSYRVVESQKNGKYAQFLVIYREGGIRDTIGVWKRYSDFEDLSHKVTQAHDGCSNVLANISPLTVTEDKEHDVEHLPNAITSWRLLKKRKRWYRCLDAGYLSLKVFLLERFLHDILFESTSPTLLREFVGTEAVSETMDLRLQSRTYFPLDT